MNKAQKTITIFLIISFLVIAGLYMIYLTKSKQNNNGSIPNVNETILYYGITCPHCKLVEEFMKNNIVESKMNITQKEVYLNSTNAQELIALGKRNNIPANEIGAVPLLYAEGRVYLGDVEVINYFKTKLNITSN